MFLGRQNSPYLTWSIEMMHCTEHLLVLLWEHFHEQCE